MRKKEASLSIEKEKSSPEISIWNMVVSCRRVWKENQESPAQEAIRRYRDSLLAKGCFDLTDMRGMTAERKKESMLNWNTA